MDSCEDRGVLIGCLLVQCVQEISEFDADDLEETPLDPIASLRLGRVPDIAMITSGLPVIIFTLGREPLEVTKDLLAAVVADEDIVLCAYWDRLKFALDKLDEQFIMFYDTPSLSDNEMHAQVEMFFWIASRMGKDPFGLVYVVEDKVLLPVTDYQVTH